MTQADIQQTILNGAYSLGVLTSNNYTLVTRGQEPVRSKFIQWFRLNLQALEDLFGIGDYVSPTCVTIYDRINQFVGIPFGATVDPNFQNPALVIDVTTAFEPTVLSFTDANLVSDGQSGYYLPVVGATGLVIVSVTSNGIGLEGLIPDYTVNPVRLYGFANNASQAIIVTAI